MPIPRGLKRVLDDHAPVKLIGRGRHCAFQLIDDRLRLGKLAGLTKRLATCVFSDGELPTSATASTEMRTGWGGTGGGRRRGKAVDAQVSKLVNRGVTLPAPNQYSLTKLALIALHDNGFVPIVAQRGVALVKARLATAADLVCFDRVSNRLCVVELKCGFSGDRHAPATSRGRPVCMKGALCKAPDTLVNRHLAQLTATRAMFSKESTTCVAIAELGLDSTIDAALLYVNNSEVEVIDLPAWWRKRETSLLEMVTV